MHLLNCWVPNYRPEHKEIAPATVEFIVWGPNYRVRRCLKKKQNTTSPGQAWKQLGGGHRLGEETSSPPEHTGAGKALRYTVQEDSGEGMKDVVHRRPSDIGRPTR